MEKSISRNCIFSLQKLIFAGYTGSKNPVRNRLKIQFVKLDFSKLIFKKPSTDQQGVNGLSFFYFRLFLSKIPREENWLRKKYLQQLSFSLLHLQYTFAVQGPIDNIHNTYLPAYMNNKFAYASMHILKL